MFPFLLILHIAIYWMMPCVQSMLRLFLQSPARLLLRDSFHLWPWKASARNHQGYEPLLTLSLFPLFSQSLFLSHTHTRHLRSRLSNKLKKPSCVLHAKKNCALVDAYHLIKPGSDCPNKGNYVRAEECQ